MLVKEYRLAMPLTVEEYRIGQLYMIAKHSHEQSEKGEGVEVVTNEPFYHEVHGQGQFTEKRVYLNSKLPTWVSSWVPAIFYITEKAWNYYPYTITEYSCSFLPRFSVSIETRFEDNAGTTENCLNLSPEVLSSLTVDHVDIAMEDMPEHKYKESEDPKIFKSKKTGRGPLGPGWKESKDHPVMCSYKVVSVKFEVWGLQTRVESFVHSSIREILLLGHKQAFAWIDDWYDLTMEDLRRWEKEMQTETNKKVVGTNPPTPTTPKEIDLNACGNGSGSDGVRTPTTPKTPSSRFGGFGFFSSSSATAASSSAAPASTASTSGGGEEGTPPPFSDK